jgi:hypothetical protein
MLDLIADLAFDNKGGGTLQPASEAAVFQEFTLPDEQDDPAGAPSSRRGSHGSAWTGDRPARPEGMVAPTFSWHGRGRLREFIGRHGDRQHDMGSVAFDQGISFDRGIEHQAIIDVDGDHCVIGRVRDGGNEFGFSHCSPFPF